MTDQHSKFRAYADTVLQIHGAGDIDLRRPVGEAERRALVAVGLDRPFAVLTAENPHGENDEDAPTPAEERDREAENDRRLAALVVTLGAEGMPFVRVDGTAPDGSYRERCVALCASREESTRLATRLGQIALFWFDGEAFWLIPAEAGEAPRRLPLT